MPYVDTLTADQRHKLEEVRRTATMETANFKLLRADPEDPLPKTEAEVNDFIRRRTAVWRDTWILPVLDDLLAGVR